MSPHVASTPQPCPSVSTRVPSALLQKGSVEIHSCTNVWGSLPLFSFAFPNPRWKASQHRQRTTSDGLSAGAVSCPRRFRKGKGPNQWESEPSTAYRWHSQWHQRPMIFQYLSHLSGERATTRRRGRLHANDRALPARMEEIARARRISLLQFLTPCLPFSSHPIKL